MTQSSLTTRLRRVRQRLLIIGCCAAIVWGICSAAAILAASIWLDLVWELSPTWRVGLLVFTTVAMLASIGVLVRFALERATGNSVASRVDQVGGTGGEILSGWQLACREKPAGDSSLTAALSEMAVNHAATAAAKVTLEEAAPARPLVRPASTALACLALVVLVLLSFPSLARTEWRRFTLPWADVPAYSRNTFDVEPGDVEVLFGSELDLSAVVHGPPVEQVELVLEGATEEIVPMFADSDGTWRTALARIVEPASYYVRADRARSERFQIDVVTIPRIEQVRVRILPPEYTGLAPYDGPVPKDGISGLPGTNVSISVRSNRPLSAGTITLRGKSETTEVLMEPSDQNEHEVVGQFPLESEGRMVLAIADTAGQASRDTYEATMTLLADESPFLRILQPKPQSMATPTANLPVELSAEDDYGLSSVKLYRSLNDSRALPAEIPLPAGVPRRVFEQIYLPLGDYRVEPGDVIKLFARAEDNDPAGAKGTESRVVVITIISQDEFDRMARIRQGLKVLSSKYREARRRLETLAAEMEALRDEIAKAPPDSAATQEARKKLQELQKHFEKEAEAFRRLAQNSLPFDLDKHLNPELDKAAELSKEIAELLKKLAEEESARNADLTAQLSELLKRLGQKRDEFDQAAMAPLEWLEAIFPLIQDQSRFVTLVLRQMDLVERLASLKGLETVDPSTKARMRDLEEEQRQIRDDLSALLDDIADHAESLPEDERLDNLHSTAMQFVEDVRASGAFEAMGDAESALAEFSGTTAHEKAQEVAEILQKFLSQCQSEQGMGAIGAGCLGFQPSLGQGLGQTVQQLLSEMGLGSGMGMGGNGAGVGGYSATRGGNVGLYGGMPGMSGQGQGPDSQPANAGRNRLGAGIGAAYGSSNPERDTLMDLPAIDRASGMGDESIPARYRRRVGQYFQRLSEEIEAP